MLYGRSNILFAFLSSLYFAFAPAALIVAQNRVAVHAPMPLPESAAATATINVNAAQVTRTVDSRMFGLNTAIWDSVFDSNATRSRLQEMSVQALRFPGGSLSDEYHWVSNTTRNNTWTWATSFDAFASVASTTPAQVFITANYGSGTAQEAADWVRYANNTKGYGFKYWEIGNECYGSWEYDTHAVPWDPYTYALAVRDYMTLMKTQDPTIKVGVVLVTGEDSFANNKNHPAVNPRTNRVHNGWTPVLLATLKSLGATPDFVIYHRYEQAPGQESDSVLLQAARTWPNDAADLRQQLTDYLGADGARVEMVVTEVNSVYANPGKQTTSLVNGLFTADTLGQILKTEFNGLLWWDLRNGQETGNNNSASLYGWRLFGDYGVLSNQSEAYPSFYVSKLLKDFARGGDAVVQATSDNTLLAAYAVKRANNALTLLVINKSPTQIMPAKVWVDGYVPDPQSGISSYGIPQDEAARTGTGSPDLAKSSFNPAGTLFNYSFAPYSATVITLVPTTLNPIDDVRLFVTQQYLDFLARNPDAAGLDYWTSQLLACGADSICLRTGRVGVADAFFFEPEFQTGGAFIYRIYRTGLGAMPSYAQFTVDRAQVVGGATLDQSKAAFALAFVQRTAFQQLYPQNQSGDQFVDNLLAALRQNSGADLTGQRSSLISLYDGTNNGRAAILRRVADDPMLIDAEYNRSFVLMEYFGYLRRDQDQGGFDFWLDQVNRRPLRDTAVQRAMACSFITSIEYQLRFGSAITHGNGECTPP
jgi:hypothetical protein